MTNHTFNFNTHSKAKTVALCYLDINNDLCKIPMISQDNIEWRVDIRSISCFQYYSYLINDLFWICSNERKITTVNKVPFNILNEKIISSKSIKVKTHLFCKNFQEPNFLPLDISNSFTNLDRMFAFWVECINIEQDTVLHMQLIDPTNLVHIMHFELLKKGNNPEKSKTIYFGMKIEEGLPVGRWIARLIHNNTILSEIDAYYSEKKISYSKHGNTDHSHLRIPFIDNRI